MDEGGASSNLSTWGCLPRGFSLREPGARGRRLGPGSTSPAWKRGIPKGGSNSRLWSYVWAATALHASARALARPRVFARAREGRCVMPRALRTACAPPVAFRALSLTHSQLGRASNSPCQVSSERTTVKRTNNGSENTPPGCRCRHKYIKLVYQYGNGW